MPKCKAGECGSLYTTKNEEPIDISSRTVELVLLLEQVPESGRCRSSEKLQKRFIAFVNGQAFQAPPAPSSAAAAAAWFSSRCAMIARIAA